jgi:hypothetical protein
MTKTQILSYLYVGSTRSVCVDCRLTENYPGWVRTITIEGKTKLRVEFDVYGYDEGGLYITIEYTTFKTLIDELEKYLLLKIEQWENVTQSGKYPELQYEVNFQKSAHQLKQDLVNKKLSLPKGGIKYTIQSTYWRNIAEGKADNSTNLPFSVTW